MHYKGGKAINQIVMKNRGNRWDTPGGFYVQMDLTREPVQLKSKCCNADIDRIGGCFRCSKCDRYCEKKD